MEEIRSLLARYCHTLDDGRADDVVATFCENGSASLPGFGVITGTANLQATYESIKPLTPQRHVVQNTDIHTRSDSEVQATSDLLFLLHGKHGWTVQLVGRYEDTICNHDGTWRFHARVLEFVDTQQS